MANNEKMSRRLVDVERVQSMTDGMQVLVNNNGAVQQIPANEIGGSGLPEGAAAHQMLITDAEGNAKWEDRLVYAENKEIDRTFSDLSWSYNRAWLQDADFNLVEGVTYTVIYNGKEYSAPAVYDSEDGSIVVTIAGNKSNDEEAYLAIVEQDGDIFLVHTESAARGGEVTIRWNEESIKTIDPQYLPATTPVIQSAAVGQTVVVKAVDEDGKPTEWEAVDMGGGAGDIAYFFANNGDEYLYHVDSATGKIGEIATAKDITMAFGRHIYITDMPGDNGYAYLEFKLPYQIQNPAYDGDNAAIALLGYGENDAIITRYYKTAEYSSGGK